MIDRSYVPVSSRYVNIGLFDLRQLFFGTFDIDVHTTKGRSFLFISFNNLTFTWSLEHQDLTKLWNTLREKVSLVKHDKLCPGQGTFGHITGGYDAGYYGYMYSLVFAADMYATVFKGDPLNPGRGKLYREKILRVGGSRDDMDSLKDLLGREPNSDAFMKSIFGSTSDQSSNL